MAVVVLGVPFCVTSLTTPFHDLQATPYVYHFFKVQVLWLQAL
jgi:hypothetical protein